MTDWFKVQMNEADRRISLEVYAEHLIKALDNGDANDIEMCKGMLKEVLDTEFDKYAGAEEEVA